jgi:cation diffusion facilitator family transporter
MAAGKHHTVAPAGISSQEASRVTRDTAALAVAAAAFLIGLKGYAWVASGSVAMLSSLADSTLDLAASLFTFFAVRYAAHPPDADHRFGHGKAEAFAGLFQAGLVAVSATLIAVEAIRRLASPKPVEAGEEAIIVMVVSIAVTAALVLIQSRAIGRTGSVATKGDRAHYAADLGANLVVIAGIAAAHLAGWTWADAVAGLAVAAWLAWGAYKVAAEAGDHLMDRELPDADRAAIRSLALAEPGLRAVHDLRTRASGPYIHIQFHADLDPALTLAAAHHIIVGAEARIRTAYPAADVIIHPDPGEAEPHGHAAFGEAASRPADGAP